MAKRTIWFRIKALVVSDKAPTSETNRVNDFGRDNSKRAKN